ncbi:ATP-dependent DNA helicase [Paenibacillus mesophilus]|uniref:ATP-dependent DNA helicase n=1 Tax=Paenibacillus mesophilus TaxID=2582849 RepID=UPI00110F5BCC|nr:ATP-dependent DNA helicase [Paenibacillus mesophilus]TMV50178.1 ATP-dependent DNA helicase [Paenibacillus mesophilus]
MKKYPFDYDPSQPFMKQVGNWVADVFYELLPEHGFEIRDEQIYMAFQLERAFQEKCTLFAEAGVGTGKTLVYLLYSICYARHMRKPVIVACANESLIEQLVKPEGDIAKLSRYLGLDIDARLGKSPDQFVCLVKLDDARYGDADTELYEELYESLPAFVRTREGLQSFHAYGDRKHYPQLNDEQWNKIGWDPYRDCFVCDKRHRCGMTLSRDYYRKSSDIIVCSHDFYMEHVWTYEGRKREGQLPLLPDHSAVIFDEGHLLEFAAQKALAYRLMQPVFEEQITRLLQGQIREELAELIDQAIVQSETLFDVLKRQSSPVPGSDRMEIRLDERLREEVHTFRALLEAIDEELVFESGLYSLNEYQQRIVEEHLEMMQKALGLFERSDALICWTENNENGFSLAIMPRTVKEVMRERVFSAGKPIIFSSATLSVDGEFRYIADSLGIGSHSSFSVASPYDYGNRMKVVAPGPYAGNAIADKMKYAVHGIQRTGGRALLLFPAFEQLLRFKADVSGYPELAGYRILFEGDGEISHLIAAFQADEQSVLCSVSLWEGLDVPGPSLSNVIVWSLPFPPQDPVFMAKRRHSADPYAEVDLPYMLLRLRQGMGRLIRGHDDSGIVMLLCEQLQERPELQKQVAALLPEGVEVERLID